MYSGVIKKDDIIILKTVEERMKEKKIIGSWEDLDFCILGPMVYSYCGWLYEQTRDKKDCLLFLGRDGYLLHRDYRFFL